MSPTLVRTENHEAVTCHELPCYIMKVTTTLTMSNRPSPRRSDTQPVNVVNADAYLERESTLPPRKRTLGDDEYIPTPKKRKVVMSSLASYAKRNVVQAVATVRGASEEDPAQCVVSGASEQRTVIEFSRVMSRSTSLDDVSVIFFYGRSLC
jgi:hypothetical protein